MKVVLTLAALALLIAAGQNGRTHPQSVVSPYLPDYGVASAPYAWSRMCTRTPELCVRYETGEAPVVTPYLMYQLNVVNLKVNEAIHPVTDIEKYGMNDYWAMPDADDAEGDCEDYALVKREILIQLGWPRDALRITVVIDRDRTGHAVLSVRAKQGDYVLDNKTDEVLLWGDAGYVFVSRESGRPRLWTALSPQRLPRLPHH